VEKHDYIKVFRNELRHFMGAPAEFPAEWMELLRVRFPLIQKLSKPDQAELQQRVLTFLGHKRFQGCGFLENAIQSWNIIASMSPGLASRVRNFNDFKSRPGNAEKL
jgi:Mlc titration factor MtfA (ptsG expression regulator)